MHTIRKSRSSKRRSQLAIARALLSFFVFLGLEVALENRSEFEADGSSCEAVHADEAPFRYEHLYPWLTTHLLNKPASGRIKVVFVPKDLVDVQQNVCRGRAYMAALIGTIQQTTPKAIVLDKFFSTASCSQTTEEQLATSSLRDAVRNARAAKIDIIVGEATDTAEFSADDSCLVRNPSYQFFDDVHSGLSKLNANREQIPLRWRVLPRQPSHSHADASLEPKLKAKPLDSLALETVDAVAPEKLTTQPLSRVLAQARQPYARLDLDLKSIPSTDLLCRAGGDGCAAAPNTDGSPVYVAWSKPLPDFKDAVVLIGSQNEVDHWLVLGQKRWGYELQASYIDALLADRYLSALSGTWIFGLFTFFLVVLEGVPAIAEFLFCERNQPVPSLLRKPARWLWVWSPAFLLLLGAGCYLGHYLPPLSVMVGVILTWVARALFNGMEYFKEQSVPDRKESES